MKLVMNCVDDTVAVLFVLTEICKHTINFVPLMQEFPKSGIAKESSQTFSMHIYLGNLFLIVVSVMTKTQ